LARAVPARRQSTPPSSNGQTQMLAMDMQGRTRIVEDEIEPDNVETAAKQRMAKEREQVFVQAFLAATSGIKGDDTHWEQIADAMKMLLDSYPNNAEAVHLHMI